MLPTIPPKTAPKKAPKTNTITPPAAPVSAPQRSPISGSVRSIADQLEFSTKRIILATTLPEKNPTTAEIRLIINITPNTQPSTRPSIANRINIATGGNAPSSRPKYEKVCSSESGFFIVSASSFARSERYMAFCRAVSALIASSEFNLCWTSSPSRCSKPANWLRFCCRSAVCVCLNSMVLPPCF